MLWEYSVSHGSYCPDVWLMPQSPKAYRLTCRQQSSPAQGSPASQGCPWQHRASCSSKPPVQGWSPSGACSARHMHTLRAPPTRASAYLAWAGAPCRLRSCGKPCSSGGCGHAAAQTGLAVAAVCGNNGGSGSDTSNRSSHGSDRQGLAG